MKADKILLILIGSVCITLFVFGMVVLVDVASRKYEDPPVKGSRQIREEEFAACMDSLQYDYTDFGCEWCGYLITDRPRQFLEVDTMDSGAIEIWLVERTNCNVFDTLFLNELEPYEYRTLVEHSLPIEDEITYY